MATTIGKELLWLICRPSNICSFGVSSSLSSLQHHISSSLAAFSLDGQHLRIHWHPLAQLRLPICSFGWLDAAATSSLLEHISQLQLPQRRSLEMCAVGATPSWKKPRQIWVAPRTTEQKKPMKSLHRELTSQLADFTSVDAARANTVSSSSTDANRSHRLEQPYEPRLTIGIFQELYTPSLRRLGPQLRKLPLQEYAVDFPLEIDSIDVVSVQHTHMGIAEEVSRASFPLPSSGEGANS